MNRILACIVNSCQRLVELLRLSGPSEVLGCQHSIDETLVSLHYSTRAMFQTEGLILSS